MAISPSTSNMFKSAYDFLYFHKALRVFQIVVFNNFLDSFQGLVASHFNK